MNEGDKCKWQMNVDVMSTWCVFVRAYVGTDVERRMFMFKRVRLYMLNNVIHSMSMNDETTQDKARQGKARQGKAKQSKFYSGNTKSKLYTLLYLFW